MDFKGKTVWITGASSGIGEALAAGLIKRGARLVLSARREAELARVRDDLVAAGAASDDILVLPMDVTEYETMPGKVEAAEAFGPVDMLVNNAGISQRSLCVDTDMETYRTLFEVDVFGQIALTKALLPAFIERSSGQVVIISSVAGKVGAPYRTGYCAAKHAVMGFFDALRAEIAKHGVKVTTVTPGFIRTNIAKNALKGDGSRFDAVDQNIAGGMMVDDCAEVILKGIESDKPEIAVGKGREMQALWIKRFMPRLIFKIASGMSKPQG